MSHRHLAGWEENISYGVGTSEHLPDTPVTPAHYQGDLTQRLIETFDLNFALGNVIKYVVRAGRKTSDPRDDLEKARWYLEREIARNGR